MELGRSTTLKRRALKFRTARKERTPYYMVDLPVNCMKELEEYRLQFVAAFGRDYEGDDPQFFDALDTGSGPKPIPGIEDWIKQLADVMESTKHHRAHVHAVRRTQKVVHEGNFKDVPDEWTIEWQKATQDYESWRQTGGGVWMPPAPM